MGGSLIGQKVGGHNVLEPIALGVPTITGPSYYNFTDIVTGLRSLHAIYIAENSSKLASILNDWLCNPSASQTFSSKALDFLQQNSGAINKTINRLGYE
jgi:3-deoxy-D-manno-octulosonic-acid transferase